MTKEEERLAKEIRGIELEKEFEKADDIPEGVLDTTRPQLFKEIISPDFKKEDSMKIHTSDHDTVNPFTKELKTSMLDRRQIELIGEMTDVAALAGRIGAFGCSKTLIAHRDTILAAAVSGKGALIKLMNTEYSIKRVGVSSEGKSFLSRKEEE